MSNYKAMYYKLFNDITDAIRILQQAQKDTEEIYIQAAGEISEEDDKKGDHG